MLKLEIRHAPLKGMAMFSVWEKLQKNSSFLYCITGKITELIKIHNLSAIFMVVLTISTDEQDSTPALCFSPAVIEFCHSVGASIELDLYRS